MIRSMLLGAVAGARSFTPLAMLALAARRNARRTRDARTGVADVRARPRDLRARVPDVGARPRDLRAGAQPLGPLANALAPPWVARGLAALAAGELLGDKLPSAPDRTVPAGLAARLASGGISGAAVAGRGRRVAGALAGAGAAVVAAHLTLDARRHAIRRHGATSSGLVEDALALGIAWLVARR